MRGLWLVVTLVGSACTLPAVVPEALNTEFKPTGEVAMYDRTIGFDAVRVRSPRSNLSKRTDGSWGGVIADRAIDVNITANRIVGVDFMMTREKSEANKLVITGQFQGRIYRFELGDEEAMIRSPRTSLTLPGRVVGTTQTVYGPMGYLQLRGEAGSESPPWPQIAFALMALVN